MTQDTLDQLRDKMISKFEERQIALVSDKAYYEAQKRPEAIGVTTPPAMNKLLANVGFPRLYVNAVAERLEMEGFRLGGNPDYDEQLWDWWCANELGVESTLGHTDALVYGRSYVTISAPDGSIDDTVPQIRVEPPTSLYASIDPYSRKVTHAIRVVAGEQTDWVATTLYLPNQTVSWVKEQGRWRQVNTVNHGLGVVPVVPLANRTRLSDLHGTSEITPELRSITDAASRIMMDMQATAELMAVPQRLLFGVKPEDIGVDANTGEALFDAYLARILAFEDPDAKAQQFNAAELRNFTEVMRELAKQAAAYTGLPPSYLSSSNDNPASAEAIRASESRLVKTVERKQLIFGAAWEQVMRVAHVVMNPGEAIPPEFYRMDTAWRDASTPTYAAKADAATKLYANGTGIIPKERARIDMGYTVAEREEMRRWDEEASPLAKVTQLYGVGADTQNPSAPAV